MRFHVYFHLLSPSFVLSHSHEPKYPLSSFSRKVKVASAVCLRKTIKCIKSSTSNSRSLDNEMKVNERNEKKDLITNKRTFTFSLSWDNPIIRFGKGIQKIKDPTQKYGSEVPRYYSRIFGDSGVSAYLIAIYGLLYSSEWENKISNWQNSVLSVADTSLKNCFKDNRTNSSSNYSDRTSLRSDENIKNDISNPNMNGNKREEDKSEGSHENEIVNNATDDKDQSDTAATVSSSYRHQLFNELYFLVDGGTVWADSKYGIPNPYSTDFIKSIYKDCVGSNNRENKEITEINGRIGKNGNNKSEEILPGNSSDERQETEINDEKKKKEIEVKKEMEMKKEKETEEEKEKENVTPVGQGRTGWFSDTMAIMLQIPEKEFKVHDYIRVTNERSASNVKYDKNMNIYNDDKKSYNSCYDYNDNHNDDDSVNSSTPILEQNGHNEKCNDIHTIDNSFNTMNNSDNTNKINNFSNNCHETENPSDNDSSDKYKKSVHENAQKNNTYDKNNVFVKEKKHILNNKNEILIAAMKALHFIMNIHDENVKNLQTAGDQVRVILNFIYLPFYHISHIKL